MEECIICLEDLNNYELTMLECGHVFHSKCIYEWFSKSKSMICPICRHKAKEPFQLTVQPNGIKDSHTFIIIVLITILTISIITFIVISYKFF